MLIRVDPTIASNRHYKRCHLKEVMCRQIVANVSVTDTALKYKSALKARTELVFKDLGVN